MREQDHNHDLERQSPTIHPNREKFQVAHLALHACVMGTRTRRGKVNRNHGKASAWTTQKDEELTKSQVPLLSFDEGKGGQFRKRVDAQ
jgi:hypothetical protein